MKKFILLFFIILLSACTSNTIFEEPKDLIPRDSMVLIIEDLVIASSSKFVKNKNGDKNVNYLPFIKEKYKIDSTRFANSNLYYVSKIDMYLEMLTEVKDSIKSKNNYFKKFKKTKDSLKVDSLKKVHKIRLDSIVLTKDSLKVDSLKQVFDDEILNLESIHLDAEDY
jgi:thiaminase